MEPLGLVLNAVDRPNQMLRLLHRIVSPVERSLLVFSFVKGDLLMGGFSSTAEMASLNGTISWIVY